MDLFSNALQVLRQRLITIPGLEILSADQSGSAIDSPDLTIRIRYPGGEKRLFVVVLTSGQPRYARQASDRLFRLHSQNPDIYGVFVAPYISRAAAAVCVEIGVGYVDLSGNCRLAFDTIFILRENLPNRFVVKKELASLFAPRSERILRALLSFPNRIWTTKGLAETANVSSGMVSHIKKMLADREWVQLLKEGFCITAPFELLAIWAENYSFRKNKLFEYYSLQSPNDMELALANICEAEGTMYALTGFSASARLAPSVRFQRAMAYVQGEIPVLAASLGLKMVTSGPNFIILQPYDEGVFLESRKIDSVQIANPIQVYLDLKNYRGRGEEAAETLLNQVIKPQW